MAPTDFSHQQCEFFQPPMGLEKSLHPLKVGCRKTAHPGELGPNVGGELFHHRLAPPGIGQPLHGHLPDIPIQADQFPVDRLEGLILGGADALLDLDQQAGVIARFSDAIYWGLCQSVSFLSPTLFMTSSDSASSLSNASSSSSATSGTSIPRTSTWPVPFCALPQIVAIAWPREQLPVIRNYFLILSR